MMVFTYTLSPFYVGMFTKDAAIRLRSVRYIKIFTAMIVPWRCSIRWWTRRRLSVM